MAKIDDSVFDFLSKLKENNNREWFKENKELYQHAHEKMVFFAEETLSILQKSDQISTPSGKKSLTRIYRDIRFSKDKTPFKNHFSGGFKRATSARRGGYYFHIEPGNCFAAGGFWSPSKEDRLLVRQQLAQDSEELREVLSSNAFIKSFGALLGDQLKTCPKGFSKDHESIDLLRFKAFYVKKDFDDQIVLNKDFSEKLSEIFCQMDPFFSCLTNYLTTDLNGVSLL